jgi:hypothetical protein
MVEEGTIAVVEVVAEGPLGSACSESKGNIAASVLRVLHSDSPTWTDALAIIEGGLKDGQTFDLLQVPLVLIGPFRLRLPPFFLLQSILFFTPNPDARDTQISIKLLHWIKKSLI